MLYSCFHLSPNDQRVFESIIWSELVLFSFIIRGCFLCESGAVERWDLLGGGYFCAPFDVCWEGVSTATAELGAIANLLHRHPQPRHSELQGCWWTCCPTLATKMGVNDKLSDLIQLRYMPTSQGSCSPSSDMTTYSHIPAVPRAGLAKPLRTHKVHTKRLHAAKSYQRCLESSACVCVSGHTSGLGDPRACGVSGPAPAPLGQAGPP